MGTEVRDFGLSAGGGVNASTGWFPEGQLPGTVNDGARSFMAAVRRAIGDLSGEQTATYSAGVYTLASNMDISALARGHAFACVLDAPNSASATIVINGLSAVPVKVGARHVYAGELGRKRAHLFVFDGASAQLLNPATFIQSRAATPYTSSTDISTQIPTDTSKPQNTEGLEVCSVSITPTSINTTLVIEFECFGAIANAGTATAALFQDSTADAIAVAPAGGSAGAQMNLKLTHIMQAGTTSSTTFKVNVGPNSAAGNFYINGNSGGALFGGIAAARMRVTEIAA